MPARLGFMTNRKSPNYDIVCRMPRLRNEYFVSVGGEKFGPFSVAKLWELYWDGRIDDRDEYMTDGLTDWTPIPALYHSHGLPYVRPERETAVNELAGNKPAPGWFSKLFRRAKTAPSDGNEGLDHTVRMFAGRCGLCEGPALPRFFTCPECGRICRQYV